MDKISPEFIGYRLLQRGFKTFFLYVFREVEGRKFIVEPLHQDLFKIYEDIVNGKENRVIINIAPRSAKTTLNKYLIAYCWAKNPKCNFIYTSYSESLLKDIAREIAHILEHPIYKALFPQQKEITLEEEYDKPINDFWAEYLERTTGKNVYSNKKIVTYAGGVCLFSAMGSQITGYGAGIKNAKGFTGALIIDDPNKPSEVRSAVYRQKTLTYYEETLLSRLNNSDTPIINVQQRLHVEDLTGQIEQKYTFTKLVKPLLDENGKCLLPNQFSPERIKELKINNYMFQAQYQQCPFIAGGEVIKRSWFRFYDINKKYNYDRIVIAGDTAMSVKESADRSCFIVGGVLAGTLHIIDFIVGRWDYPTLKKNIINLWNKWQNKDLNITSASNLCIEDKASGIQLLQELRQYGIPLTPLQADKDKLTRVESVLEYIANGNVMLPENEQYGYNPEILNELESFTRDDSHLHDDICFVAGTKIATITGDKNIEDIKAGDYVITPLGIRRVLIAGCTGIHKVITKRGLTGTPNHKVFINGQFDKLSHLEYDVCIDRLSYKGLFKWTYKKLLYSMESPIDLWERKDIISVNQIQIKGGEVLKDFTLRFGSFIADRKFLKAMSFITKTGIAIITTTAIWSVYRLANIWNCTLNKEKNKVQQRHKDNSLKKSDHLQANGTRANKVESGTETTLKKSWKNTNTNKYAPNVVKNTKLAETDISVKNAKVNYFKENSENREQGISTGNCLTINAEYAEKNLKQKHERLSVQQNVSESETISCMQNEKKPVPVFNLKVEGVGVYYANGILVSNCDAMTYLIMATIANRQVSILEVL